MRRQLKREFISTLIVQNNLSSHIVVHRTYQSTVMHNSTDSQIMEFDLFLSNNFSESL